MKIEYILAQSNVPYLLHCLLSKRIPISHCNIDIGRYFFCFQSTFQGMSLQRKINLLNLLRMKI